MCSPLESEGDDYGMFYHHRTPIIEKLVIKFDNNYIQL